MNPIERPNRFRSFIKTRAPKASTETQFNPPNPEWQEFAEA